MSKTLRKEYKTNSKKSLCKSKKEKKCKKIKGCKMTKGPKKTFCRKIKNKKYRKTVKKGGEIKRKTIEEESEENLKNDFLNNHKDGDILEIDMLADAQNGEKYYLLKENNGNKELILLDTESVNYAKANNELIHLVNQYNGGKILIKKTKGGFTVGDAVNMASKSPLGSQLKAEAEKKIQQQKEQAKQKLMTEGQKILNKKIPIDGLLKNQEMRKLAMEVATKTPMKGGDLDALLKGYTKNNTNRSMEDMLRETKEHEKKAAEYRYNANQLAHESANQYRTMDNEQTRVPFSNGGKNKFLKSA